ncbi:hypothetical protein [Vibrio sp. WXL103]|uniref:hypothetical protein n=1 Tax=Vibrio sp. WXL103 TaxID=3450710 RepID=UPI003EC55CA4
MTIDYRINRDIYEAISSPSMQYFRIIEVRDLICANSNKYGTKQTARAYVGRELGILARHGLLASTGVGHNRKYYKTSLFYKVTFELREKKVYPKCRKTYEQPVRLKAELEKERELVGKELAEAKAKETEYESLMRRSNQLREVLRDTYDAATKESSALTVKWNVLSHTIKLLDESNSHQNYNQ